MAGTKREKELHRAKIARLEREHAEARARRKRNLQITGVVAGVLIVVLAVVGIAVAQGDDSSDNPAASPAAASTSTASPAASSDAATSSVKCTAPNDKKPLDKKYDKVDATLQPVGVYSIAMTTNCGKIDLVLDRDKAPETTKALAFLSDRQYFDNTECHRLTTSGLYVLQCGDPTGTGSGGPGFQIAEENLPKAGSDGSAIYKRGTVAMANAGKGTTGSQFFLVYKDSPLPPDYTVVGTVKDGMQILDYVAGKGTTDGGSDGKPKQPLQIQKMISSIAIPVTDVPGQ